MAQSRKNRSGNHVSDSDIIDVEDNLEPSQSDYAADYNNQQHSEGDYESTVKQVSESIPTKSSNTGIIAGILVATAAVVGGGYFYMQSKQVSATTSLNDSAQTLQVDSNLDASKAVVLDHSGTALEQGGQTISNGINQLKQEATSVTESVQQGAAQVGESMSQGIQSAQDEVANALQEAKTVVNQTATTVAEGVSELKTDAQQSLDHTQEKWQPVGSAMAEGAQSLHQEAVQVAEQVADHTQNMTHQAGATLAQGVEQAENVAQQAGTAVVDTVQALHEHPAETSVVFTPEEAAPDHSATPIAVAVGATAAHSAQWDTLQVTLATQEQKIAQLQEQLHSVLEQNQNLAKQAKTEAVVHSEAMLLNDVNRLVSNANFELEINANVPKTLNILQFAMRMLNEHPGQVANTILPALEADYQALQQSAPVNVDLLFKACAELSRLLAVAPFIVSDQAATASGTEPVNSASAPVSEPSPSDSSWFGRTWSHLEQVPGAAYSAIRSDLGGLVKVEKLNSANLAFVSVEQAQLIRTQLQKNVQLAQEGLMKQSDSIWNSSLTAVVQGLQSYYDKNSVDTHKAMDLASQLLQQSVKVDLPNLKATEAAIGEASLLVSSGSK